MTLVPGAFQCAFAAPSAAAEDASAAEERDAEFQQQTRRIIVYATRTPVLKEEAPTTVTVITGEEIGDQLAKDIRDLVRFEAGVTVRRAPSRFGATFGATSRARNENFAVRGISGNPVLIQLDGICSPRGFSFGPKTQGAVGLPT